MKVVRDGGDEFAVVGNVVIPVAEDGHVCAGASFEEMLYAGLLGEHAPSGMVFDAVGFDEWDWVWHPWKEELDYWCGVCDAMEKASGAIAA